MQEQNDFQLPILTIKEIKPLLIKDDKAFAYQINAVTQNNEIFTLYENKGLDLTSYIGKEMECILEITKGAFEYKDEDEEEPKNTIVFQYKWLKRLNEYFPELIKLHEELNQANGKEEDSIQEIFEATAAKLFQDWGLNGIHLGIYQDKPLLSTLSGFFLLNEYEFEEEIELLELNQEVYIRVDELYLRGIRPHESDKETDRKAKKWGFNFFSD